MVVTSSSHIAAGPSDEHLISRLRNRLSSSLRATYLQPTCSLPAHKNAYSSRWLIFYACLFDADTKAEASAEAAEAGAELEAEAEAKAEAKAAKAEAKAEVAQAVAKAAQAAEAHGCAKVKLRAEGSGDLFPVLYSHIPRRTVGLQKISKILLGRTACVLQE